MEEKQWNVILEKIIRNVPVLINPAAEKVNVVSVLPIIGTWVNSPDVYSLPRWRELTTVRLKNLLKPIRKVMSNG